MLDDEQSALSHEWQRIENEFAAALVWNDTTRTQFESHYWSQLDSDVSSYLTCLGDLNEAMALADRYLENSA